MDASVHRHRDANIILSDYTQKREIHFVITLCSQKTGYHYQFVIMWVVESNGFMVPKHQTKHLRQRCFWS